MKKIMCLLFVVFFTMLSIITFFNYSNYCETLPYEGLKEISVKQLRGNYTNKDYIKLLEEKMASINADLMYRATDFSSEKTSYILYKTNNKDDFFQKLDLKNNGKILSPNQCFSTLSTVKNFEVYPMGISSATCDVTIEDFSYIEKYVLKSCVFYTSSDDVYTVTESLKELGLLVELTDSGFAQSMNDMQQPYLLLFVLNLQRSKGFKYNALFFSNSCRRYSMKSCKSLSKTIGRVIAILHSNIYYFLVRGCYFISCKCKPAVSNVLTHRKTTKHCKTLLKIKS